MKLLQVPGDAEGVPAHHWPAPKEGPLRGVTAVGRGGPQQGAREGQRRVLPHLGPASCAGQQLCWLVALADCRGVNAPSRRGQAPDIMSRDADLGSNVRECSLVWYSHHADSAGRRDLRSMASSKINRTG